MTRHFPTSLPDLVKALDVRMATVDDADEIALILRDYFAATDWADYITFDLDLCARSLRERLDRFFRPHILAVEKDSRKIVGLLSYSIEQTYSVEPIAILQEFWAAEAYQRSGIGRLLMAFFIDLATADGATVIHAPIAYANPRTNKSLRNLLAKAGFHEFGYMMRRGLGG